MSALHFEESRWHLSCHVDGNMRLCPNSLLKQAPGYVMQRHGMKNFCEHQAPLVTCETEPSALPNSKYVVGGR